MKIDHARKKQILSQELIYKWMALIEISLFSSRQRNAQLVWLTGKTLAVKTKGYKHVSINNKTYLFALLSNAE